MPIKIAPSILTADFSNLDIQVREAINAGADFIHLDVMDGHFVPDLTFGPLVVSALKPITSELNTGLDVHLMIEKPELKIPDFIEAGADNITVHVEASRHLHRTINQIKNLGAKAGVALNPATPLVSLEQILPDLDLVLILSVNPGYGGQAYIPSSTEKIIKLRKMLDERGLNNIEIEVDGGIKAQNAVDIANAGGTILVVGSAIFNQESSISDNMLALRERLITQ